MAIPNNPFTSTERKDGPPYNVKHPLIGVAIILLLIGTIIGFQLGRWSTSQNVPQLPSPPPAEKGCTLEAKRCPDGSYVGRIPPDCEFQTCPTIKVSPTENPNSDECVKAGCNSELCVKSSQSDTPSPCVYLEEYKCLGFSRCERQKNGECGWTKTLEYNKCLDDIKKNS